LAQRGLYTPRFALDRFLERPVAMHAVAGPHDVRRRALQTLQYPLDVVDAVVDILQINVGVQTDRLDDVVFLAIAIDGADAEEQAAARLVPLGQEFGDDIGFARTCLTRRMLAVSFIAERAKEHWGFTHVAEQVRNELRGDLRAGRLRLRKPWCSVERCSGRPVCRAFA
jgi:hypothetical protein